MSFILEALKKSDKERRHGTQPDVFSPDIDPPSFTTAKKRNWFTAMLGATSIGLIALISLYFIFSNSGRQDTISEVRPASKPAEHIAPASKTGSEMKKEIVRNELSAEKTTLDDHPPAEQVGPTVMNSAVQYLQTEKGKVQYLQHMDYNSKIEVKPLQVRSSSKNVQDYADISPALAKQLPELKFAGHTYSKSPSSRLIIVNGKILRENQLIDINLRLVEITPNGVILDFRGTVFSLQL